MSNTITSKTIIHKQPSETLNVSMDFSNWLSSGVTLSSPSVSESTGDITITNTTVSGQTVAFTIAGGTHGKTYRIEVAVDTSESESLLGDGLLKVRGR